MDEYIKREEAIELIRLNYCKDCNSYNGARCRACSFDDAMLAIEDVPSADVVEVRSGEWIKKEDGHYVCSECGRTRPYSNYANAIDNWVCNYCYYCGAIMDGGKKQ